MNLPSPTAGVLSLDTQPQPTRLGSRAVIVHGSLRDQQLFPVARGALSTAVSEFSTVSRLASCTEVDRSLNRTTPLPSVVRREPLRVWWASNPRHLDPGRRLDSASIRPRPIRLHRRGTIAVQPRRRTCLEFGTDAIGRTGSQGTSEPHRVRPMDCLCDDPEAEAFRAGQICRNYTNYPGSALY